MAIGKLAVIFHDVNFSRIIWILVILVSNKPECRPHSRTWRHFHSGFEIAARLRESVAICVDGGKQP
jgi:hypothetical protein